MLSWQSDICNSKPMLYSAVQLLNLACSSICSDLKMANSSNLMYQQAIFINLDL